MKPLTSISPLSREATPQVSPLLRLPLELRSRIYVYACSKSRCPSAEDVYSNSLSAVWKDKPSPLLAVNGQVRDELCEMLRKCPVSLRITGQDMKFDSIGLSCFIAHQQCTFTGNIPALIVQVWAPNRERPVETSNIWNSLRRLRDDLRACKQIRRLDIQFRDNELYSWSQNGVLGYWLSTSEHLAVPQPCDSDIGHMITLFFSLNNTSMAKIKLPASILDHKENEALAEYTEGIECLMENEELDSYEYRAANKLEAVRGLAEGFLKYKTAVLAMKKLNDITQSGRFRMSRAEYLDFVRVWPHFEALSYLISGHSFPGCTFYADIHGQEEENQWKKSHWHPTREQRMAWDIWLGLKGLDDYDLETRWV
ncbi:hypothetical protein JMJ35_000587 [Cladonia borealis]|uniref:Uncharacterized protein n=1 Tax=Cladonia borealis TaxID=184061 RepID=A0AA39R9J2_9LECA|nr:hypothetical protein JMJ35_000587 [Cladonia borealis]